MIISNLAIKNKTSVFVLTLIIILMGFMAYSSLPREAAPSITIPIIVVVTPYFGVSPSDIENLVTKPIEKKLKELSDVKEITSTSSEGVSSIMIEFEPDVDLDNALQKVRDKVNLAKPELPTDAEESSIQETSFDNIPIMLINISGAYGLVKLKEIAEDLEDQIESIPGVLDVRVSGGLEREVQVNVNPDRLTYYNLSLQSLIDAVRKENLSMPGGSIEAGNLKYLVRVPGEFSNPQEIGSLIVKSRNSKPIYVKDVAQVVFGFKARNSYARLNGLPCVSLSIQKRSGENLIAIADRIKALLEEQKPLLPPTTEIAILADQSKQIHRMVNDLENNILSGLILVVVVLFLFMGVRNAIFVALAIPLSMLLSFIIIQAIGYTLNMVVLFSLILALGMLVDNAIVVVENIYRHREEGYSLVEAARRGTSEVAIPVIASTLTTLGAFAPMLFWPGIIGEFMGYLPFTLIVTLTCSLFVGLVINPTVCSVFMRVTKKKQEQAWYQKLLARYERNLIWALNHRGWVLGGAAATLLITLMLYGILGKGVQFFPEIEPRQVYIDLTQPTGTRLGISDGVVRQVETKLPAIPDIEQYVSNVGSSTDPMDFNIGGGGTPHKSRVVVDFLDRQYRSQSSFKTVEEIRKSLDDLVGVRVDLSKPRMGPPAGAPINIELAGDDFSTLGRLAKEVKQRIKDVPGLVDLKDDFDAGRPELRIGIDREKAALLGLSTRTIAQTVRTAINGTKASDLRIGEDDYDITVRFAEKSRKTLNELSRIKIVYEGQQIPLANVADLQVTGGFGSIRRKDLERVVSVKANVEGRLPNTVLGEVQDILAKMPIPAGYSLRYAGENVEQDKAKAFLSKAFTIALLLIFLIMVTQFNSVTLPGIIMISVLLSLIGVFWGLILTQTPFGIIMTGIGVISLAGVVVNNAIVLIDYIGKLRERGFSRRDAIVKGGSTRLRPVILTAITTILGLIPLSTGLSFDFRSFALEINGESSQWWGPMGVAVIFGLAFATLLTLVVVPVLYELITDLTERHRKWLRPEEDQPPLMAKEEGPEPEQVLEEVPVK